MRKRWLASAIMQSEELMHRIRGFMGIRALVVNIEKLLEEKRMIVVRAS